MKNRFHLTTRELAELTGMTLPAIQRHYQRTGAWRGVVPNKARNRLYWPQAEVLQALGRLPDLGENERLLLELLQSLGVPADETAHDVVLKLASSRREMINPARELWGLVDLVECFLQRARRHGVADTALELPADTLRGLAEALLELARGAQR